MTIAKDIRNRSSSREQTEKRRSRGRHGTSSEQTVLIVAGLGAVFLFAVIAIAAGNRKPPPPPPAKSGPNIIYEEQNADSASDSETPKASAKKKKKKQAAEEEEEVPTKVKTARRTKDTEDPEQRPKPVQRLTDLEQGENVPVPSWLRDNDGRDLTKEGQPSAQPTPPANKPVSTDPKEEDEPDRVRTNEGKSTFSPWNSGQGDGEMP